MVKHIPAHQQIADIFTKSLPTAAFQSLRFKLGVDVPPTPSLRGDISKQSSVSAQVQSKEETPAKARLSREEKGKAKVVDDKPCASSASSSRVQDQRSQRDILSQSKCHDKTQSKTSTVGVFNVKLSNAFSALDGADES